jgi:hypothetical protein
LERENVEGPSFELAIKLHQVRHAADARAASISPEFKHNHLAAEVGELDGLARLKVGRVDLRSRLASQFPEKRAAGEPRAAC